MLILIAVKGPDKGTVFELQQDQRHLIGRQSQTIRMRDRKLSRRHAEVYFHDGRWFLEDTGSTNGTRINADSIEEPTPLNDGDRIQLGRTVFVVGRLHAGDQPMHATQAPHLDAAMQLHDSEQDFKLDDDDAAADLDALIAAEQSGFDESHASRSASSAAGRSRSQRSASHAARSSSRRSSSRSGGKRDRSRSSRESVDQSTMPLTNGKIHPKFAAVPETSSRGFWVLAAMLLLLIGLAGANLFRDRIPFLAPGAGQGDTAINAELIARFRQTDEQVKQIAGLIESQNQAQNDTLVELREALAALPAPVDEQLVEQMVEQLKALPDATGEAMMRDVLAAIEAHAQKQNAMLEEVRTALRTTPSGEPTSLGTAEALASLRTQTELQTEAILTALRQQPEPAGKDLIEEVLAELRAAPRPDATLPQQIAELIEAETKEQNAALLVEMRAALAEPRPIDPGMVDALAAQLGDRPALDGEALREQIVAAVDLQINAQNEALLAELRSGPAMDEDKLAQRIITAVAATEPQLDTTELSQQIARAIESQATARHEALLNNVREAMAAQPNANEELVNTLLAELRDQPQLDANELAQQLAVVVNAQSQARNEALIEEMRAALESQPRPASEQMVQQVLAAMKEQTQEHSKAVLAEVRAQLQLENQALLEELLASLQTGEGGLADASGSTLLSHMRPMTRPGPMSLDRQRIAQHERFASGQSRPSRVTASPARPDLLAADREMFQPNLLDGPGETAESPASPVTAPRATPPAAGNTTATASTAAAKPEVGVEVRTPTGLVYIVSKLGQGTVAEVGDTVLVHYTGYLADGTEFDSSRKRDKPFGFELGKGSVIRGWEQGVLGMAAGERRILQIPADLAYGARGFGLNIPPNADLTFDLELISVLKAPGND